MRPAICVLLVLLSACAGTTRRPDAKETIEAWAEATLATLTLQEKVGQMIYPESDGVFFHETEPALAELLELARAGRIGGVVFFRGYPFETAAIANRLQEVSRLPLLMASDHEWGTVMRVEGGSRFPMAMALGAGGTEDDLELQAEVTAREARALGIHLLLNPVVDVSTNARNRVIGTRSFGQDPERVARLGVAYIRRAQELGVLTTAKHFPGHGGTAVDSHHGLPILRQNRAHLDRVELVPFRAAVRAGVAAVMPGHIAAPALDGRDDVPATLSKEILEGLLRKELGFRGLIVSDALDMGGARDGSWDGEVAARAVAAGVDMLIVPPNPRVTHGAVVRAVERGDISRERIEDAVRRILKAKQKLGLHRRRSVDLGDLTRRVGSVRVQERVDDIAARAVTLVRNREDLLPFSSERPPEILLVDYVHERDGETEPDILFEELERRAARVRRVRLSPRTTESRAREIDPSPGEIVLFAGYARRGPGLELGERLARLPRQSSPLVVAAMRSPFLLKGFEHANALVATYDPFPPAQRALARALFGETRIGGRLPVTLSEEYPLEHGIEIEARRMKLEKAKRPEDVGLSAKGLRRVIDRLGEVVEERAAPGGVLLVARRGQIVLEAAVGRMSYADDAKRVTPDTLFDLASLTKVVVSTTLSMIFHERGELDLDSPVSAYIPEFHGGEKNAVLVKDLLAHSGGLLWWTELYKEFEGESGEEAKRGYIRRICEMPLDYPPRSKTVYSDLGILLLGEILERIGGKTLDVLAREEIFEPLGTRDLLYAPPETLRSRIAPTEEDAWRGRVLRGEVHDENAHGLGGVAPHAGLFGTARSLAAFAQMMLNGGAYNGKRLLNARTIERFTRRAGLVDGSSRAFGWDTPSSPSSSGRYFSESSFGHTGFTGTSLWIDPDRDLLVVLLTNRVHPTRENKRLYELRPALHDAVMEAIVDEEIAPRAGDP